MRKNLYIAFGVIIVVIIFLWIFLKTEDTSTPKIIVPVKSGEFRINVTTSGELEAKSSQKIYGPDALRTIRIWNVKIENMIPDGTVVDSGAYVATLDRTEITNRIKDLESEVEKLESQYIKTKLDTTMDLRNARNELINLKYALEEKKIKLEQSKYEPPATIRQYQIDLEKAERDYVEATRNYNLKYEKAKATMQEVAVSLGQEKRNLQQLLDAREEFIVKAPKEGMVIYKRNWDGSKQGIGSTVNAWDNVVAELPDLSKMISKTYINEIDISKVKVNQNVEIGIDAFPDKSYTGKVIEVANIGEQMRNSNAKVFEVLIEVNEFDSILRPAMTTKNIIITAVYDSVVFVPVESINNNDSLTFVFTSGRTRQQVILGESNENEVIVRAGLSSEDEVNLIPPDNPDKYRFLLLDTAVVNKFKKIEPQQTEPDKEDIPDKIPSDIKTPPGGEKRDFKPAGARSNERKKPSS